MSGNFGQAAARLANLSAQLLGWRPSEFWEATPAELMLALEPPTQSVAAPDAAAIEALKTRFPDEGKS